MDCIGNHLVILFTRKRKRDHEMRFSSYKDGYHHLISYFGGGHPLHIDRNKEIGLKIYQTKNPFQYNSTALTQEYLG